jgi:hypothetical protein
LELSRFIIVLDLKLTLGCTLFSMNLQIDSTGEMAMSEQLKAQVLNWPGVSVHGHRFGGTEFCFGKGEIGHTHPGGIVDIPMPRAIHDALLEEGLAEQHRWAPESGWITFRIRDEKGLRHALWLMRLSYLRYSLRQSDDPKALFDLESETLSLSPRFVDLLAKFLPAEARTAVPQKLAAQEWPIYFF